MIPKMKVSQLEMRRGVAQGQNRCLRLFLSSVSDRTPTDLEWRSCLTLLLLCPGGTIRVLSSVARKRVAIWWSFALGAVLALLGTLSFFVATPDTYWAMHSVWHVAIQLSPFFFLLSVEHTGCGGKCGKCASSRDDENQLTASSPGHEAVTEIVVEGERERREGESSELEG